MVTTSDRASWWNRRGPEAALALLAGVVFLGFLGSVDLWGKREQRASAEAIDTLDHGHWLVAEIQGRARLEKPPLPRWTIAALMALTGRRDEWAVRLPGAISALGMVGLVYGLGRRLGGRSTGLSAGLVLTSMGFFVAELRQGGNDGPLSFFTTLALYAAWRRLHAEGAVASANPGSRSWNLLMYAAIGLGVLCKGPIVVLIVAVTVIPYLACARRLRDGLRLLADARGAALFFLLALSWPVPVLVNDPNALKVWLLEMGQKTGAAGIPHPHHGRLPLAADWPWMTLPWAVVATIALILPFRRDRSGDLRPGIWFPWWWAAGNLATFGLWSVAKPSYFLPCLPGAALLCGTEWVRLTREARGDRPEGVLARRILQSHWVALFVAAAVAPVVAPRLLAPAVAGWIAVSGLALAVGVVASAWAWRRGADALALAPMVAAGAVCILVGYGAIAPTENDRRSHRPLAEALERLLPADARTLAFFHELDEGLWFYLRGRDLVAIPGSRPEYNGTYLAIEQMRNHRFERNATRRMEAQQRVLLSWLRRSDRPSSYILLRDTYYDLFSPALAGLAEPVLRERDLKRNALVLLRVLDRDAIASTLRREPLEAAD